MKALRIIKSVRRILFLNPLRVTLSLAGIAIGIASVIIIVALGEGARSNMLSQIEAMGSNVITIDAGLVKEVTGRRRQASKVTTLKENDAAAISDECRSVTAVAPTQEQTLVIKYENGSATGRIIGTSPAFPEIRNFSIASGRFFSDEDNKLSRRFAVIGHKFVEYLFRNTDPVGETIKINNIPFEVIGVLKPKGLSYDGANEDDMIFIPLNTGLRRVFNIDYLKNIYVQVKNNEEIPAAERELRSVLRTRHRLQVRNKEDDFTIQNVYTVLQAENETNASFTGLITGVAALSLLVGGVGILATMLLSVKERRPEIGLRMAIGARTNDILFQFLSESVILSVAGGAVGILTGTAGAFLLGMLTDFAIRVSSTAALLSVCISVAIGVFFGAYPAQRASRIEPIKALKL
ncbi:MAG: ABC transporter permease [Ignavibacteriales bacterium]|nr:ABC transporter permease [Ignavibacteriales bacterium]